MSTRRYDATRFQRTYSWFPADSQDGLKKSYSFTRQQPVPVDVDGVFVGDDDGLVERTLRNLEFTEETLVDEAFASDAGQFSQFSIGNAGSFAVSGGAGVVTLLTGAQRDRFIRVAGTQLDGPVAWVQANITATTGAPTTWNIGAVGFARNSTNYVYAEQDIRNNQIRLNYNFNGVSATRLATLTLTAPFQLALSIYKNRLTVYYDDASSESWTMAFSITVSLSSVDLTTFDFTDWLPSFGASMSNNATTTWSFDNLEAYPNRIDWAEFRPAGLDIFTDDFSADTSQLTVAGTSPATATISGGTLTLADTDSGTTFAQFNAAPDLEMPQAWISLTVPSFTGTVGRVGVGLYKDSTHYVFGRYNRVTSTVDVIARNGGGEVVVISVAYTAAPSSYGLAISIVRNNVSVYIDLGEGGIRITGAAIGATLNLIAAIFAGSGYKPAIYTNSTGAQTYVIDNFSMGRFGGVGIRDMIMVTDEGGIPIKVDDEWLFCATVNDGLGQGNTALFTIDLVTRYLTCLGVIMINRDSGIWNDLGCQLLRTSSGWRILMATWGNGFGGSLEILYKHETSLNLSSGSNVVSGMSTLQLPGYGVGGRYQCTALVAFGKIWFCYDETTTTSFGGNTFNIHVATAEIDQWEGPYTSIFEDDAHRDYEGAHIYLFNDNEIQYATGGPDHSRCYDIDGNFLNNLDADGAFVGGADTFPHPVIFPNGNERVLMTFDNLRFLGGTFSWGNLRLLTSPRYE